MSKLDMIKLASRCIVGASTSFTVKSVINTNLQEPETTAEVCKMAIGSVVIGSMAAKASKDYIDSAIDSIAELVQTVKDKKSEEQV